MVCSSPSAEKHSEVRSVSETYPSSFNELSSTSCISAAAASLVIVVCASYSDICSRMSAAISACLTCDVLSAWPKAQGILQAVRTLGPDVILCDELGDGEEVRAVMQGLHAGVRFVLTVHAASREDLSRRPPLRELTSTGAFDRLILLESCLRPGRVRQVSSL